MSKTGPIIIVDDDEEDQEMAREIIRDLGYSNKVVTFSSCEEAYNYLVANISTSFFIIICDINLPRMNGIELKRKVDSNDALRKSAIPFVYYSTSGNKHIIEKAYQIWCRDFSLRIHQCQK